MYDVLCEELTGLRIEIPLLTRCQHLTLCPRVKKPPWPGFEPGYPSGNRLSGHYAFQACAIPGYATTAYDLTSHEKLFKCFYWQ